MVGLPDSEKILRIRSAVSKGYRHVMDRQTVSDSIVHAMHTCRMVKTKQDRLVITIDHC